MRTLKTQIKIKTFWSILFCVMLLILVFNTGVSKEMSSVTRPYSGSPYTIIDSQQVPLAPSVGANSLEALTLSEINDIRVAAGLNPLLYSENLTQAALIRAMECDRLFSHTRPNGADWYTVDPAIMYGENLAQGYSDPGTLTTAWMNSPAHRELILDEGFTTCGIGSFKAANGVVYVAAEFGY